MNDGSLQPVRRALISVHDKSGLVPFARALAERGIELLSTGGTARGLSEAGLRVRDVSAVTGFPEMLDGRVKTLHPAIHAGLLARRDRPDHLQTIEALGIAPIDLLVVNLYPFAETAARGGSYEDCVEQIDIGGPALIRAAAKNHAAVAVVTDTADYPPLLAELAAHGGATTGGMRRRLMARAFERTAAYDAAIAGWLAAQDAEPFPETLVLAARLKQRLRYGENPHQRAAFYATGHRRPGVATAEQIQGKELSYNNLNDTDAAYELVAEFEPPAVAIIKHANPCGVATAGSLIEAFRAAHRCDPVSAYGGIVAVNRSLDLETAEAIGKLFAEVVIAPTIAPAAAASLRRRSELRVLIAGEVPDAAAPGVTLRSLAGGLLLQDRDAVAVDMAALATVSKREPSAREMNDLLFAFRVAKHVKSNAIVYARDGATVGIGAGQMSRVDSSRIAALKAAEAARAAGLHESPTRGSVVASDAFFPFADGLLAAIEAGATAVIQPGGSRRDAEVIAAADQAGMAMVFNGLRHFRH